MRPRNNNTGHTYFERGKPVVVLIPMERQGPAQCPYQTRRRNQVVRPFRGLRKVA